MSSVDDIISGLCSSFGVSENNIHSEHPRFSKYKNEGKVSESQRARRLAHLERQARSRDDCLNRTRGFPDRDQKDESETNNHVDVSVDKDKVKKKSKNPFADVLMYSEWLVDIPDVGTLSTEWIMLPSPKGKRALLVARNGRTIAYYKSGNKICKGVSDLPGGNAQSYKGCTMLDGIFVRATKGVPSKYYVLDMLSWKDVSFTNMHFDYRRFFVQSRLEETPVLSAVGRFSLQLLPSCLCTQEAMTELMKRDFDFELDGLLFYYSQAIYIPEQTPLVGWLKPWMLPEILGVDVPECYKQGQGEFSTSEQFIRTFNEKHHFKSVINPPSVAPVEENLSP